MREVSDAGSSSGWETVGNHINLYKRGDYLKVTQFFHVTKERGKNQKGAPEIREETGKPCLTVRLLQAKLRQHSRCWEGLLSVQQEGFTWKPAKQPKPSSKPGRFLSFLAQEQFCQSGKLEPGQRTASAACWGDGWGEGSVWAAGFCHRAFPLQEAYNEFPWHDKDNVLKWSTG